MGVVVLPEHEAHQMPAGGDDGQGVELVVPDDIIGGLQAGALRGGDDFLRRGHEFADRGGRVHAAHPVVPAGDEAQQLSGAGAVIRDRHGGVAGPFLQGQHVRQRVPQAEIGVADDKARLVVLHPPYHLRLLLDGLGDIDEGDAALLRQGDAHLLSGYRLHDGGDHGHVHGESGLLPPPVLHHRGLEGDVCGNALRGGVAGHQQVLTEGTGGLGEKISHRATSFHQISSGSWIYRSSWKNSVDSTGLSL